MVKQQVLGKTYLTNRGGLVLHIFTVRLINIQVMLDKERWNDEGFLFCTPGTCFSEGVRLTVRLINIHVILGLKRFCHKYIKIPIA